MGRKKRRAPFGVCAAFRDCIPEGNKGQEKRYGIRVEARVGPDTVKLCGWERESAVGGFLHPAPQCVIYRLGRRALGLF